MINIGIEKMTSYLIQAIKKTALKYFFLEVYDFTICKVNKSRLFDSITYFGFTNTQKKFTSEENHFIYLNCES